MRSIQTNIVVKKEEVEDSIHIFVQKLSHFLLEFEDQNVFYKVFLTKKSFRRKEDQKDIPESQIAKKKRLINFLLANFGFFFLLVLPLISYSIFYLTFLNARSSSVFTATRLHSIIQLMSQLGIFKFLKDVNDAAFVFMILLIYSYLSFFTLYVWFKHNQKYEKDKKFKIVLALFVVCGAGWVALVWRDMKWIFNSFYLYSFLVVCDLIFLSKKSRYMNTKHAAEVWVVIMLHVLAHPLWNHFIYFLSFNHVHCEASKFPKKYLIRDLALLFVMIFPFMVRFRFMPKPKRTTPRRIKNPIKIEPSAHIKPVFINQREDGQPEFHYNQQKYDFSMQKNVPVVRKAKKEVPNTKFADHVYGLVNLNSRRPLLSKDYTAFGIFGGKHRIRYVANGKKSWDQQVIRSKVDEAKVLIIGEDVWMNNQQRRDMAVYTDRYSLGVNLVCLSNRKLMVRPSIPKFYIKERELTGRAVVFTFLGVFNTPALLIQKWEDIYLCVGFFRGGNASWVRIQGLEKFNSKVGERRDRKLLRQKEYAFLDNLIAVKQTWVDLADYDRDVLNETKYQQVLVVKVAERDFEARVVKSLDKITEGMFSALRIDHFFFVDNDTLALIMDSKIYLVNWKRSSVKRCIEIADLYAPLLANGVKREECFTSYWYDRARGMIRFSVGTFKGGISYGKKDINRYLTDLDKIDVNYYYSGWFSDAEIKREGEGETEVFAKDHVKGGFGSSDSGSEDGDLETEVGISSFERKRLLEEGSSTSRKRTYQGLENHEKRTDPFERI